MPEFDVDVFVAGGGPAGLAAAIAARQKGFRTAVADILRPPIDKACGEGLMPDSVVELERLGISLHGVEQGQFRGIRFVGPQHSVEAAFPRGTGIGVRRTALHRLLAAHAEQVGVQFMWETRVDGLCPDGVIVNGRPIRARWIVGADGQNSLVRSWAGLDASREFERRIALRRHYRLATVPEFVEIHWGEVSQAYITPVTADEICVAIISKRKINSFETELSKLPTLLERLRGARVSSEVRGSATVSNRLRRVYRDNVVLVGEASGSVDAITGEGLALAFRHALLLGDALVSGDLTAYEKAHRKIQVVPQFMRRSMLLMDKSTVVRRKTLRVLHKDPRLFARMLSVHVGELPLLKFGLGPLVSLGWQMVKA
jgi:menaquinone-9 beta-reductase